jgi:hypothetical protein
MILSTHGIIGSSVTVASTLNTNLFAIYKAESNVNDSLGTYNGTAQGGLTYTAGKSGNSFDLNGTNAYVDLPNNSFNFTGDFSVSGWINQSSLPAYQMVISNQAEVSNNFYGWIVWMFNNKLTFDLYNANLGTPSARWQTTSTLTTNQWYHIAVTKKPNQSAKIYLNGTIDVSLVFGSNSGNLTYTSTNFSTLGVNKYISSVSDGFFNGKIDEVNVWNKELTSTEVTELYNLGNGKFYPY